MRLAIMSDVHGNSIALDAVLADIRASGGVDGYWVLGDLAAIGFDPIGTLERIRALPNVCVVRGNTDRYITSGALPPPGLDDVRKNIALVEKYTEIVASFAWTAGAIATSGWLGWLEGLPLEERLVLPDGTRLLGVHAAPGTDDGSGLAANLTTLELAKLVEDCGVDIVCVGHKHQELYRQAGAVRVINLASVSTSQDTDLRAFYLLIEADSSGYRLESHRVEYDREAVISELHRLRHPARHYISALLRGEIKATRAVGPATGNG